MEIEMRRRPYHNDRNHSRHEGRDRSSYYKSDRHRRSRSRSRQRSETDDRRRGSRRSVERKNEEKAFYRGRNERRNNQRAADKSRSRSKERENNANKSRSRSKERNNNALASRIVAPEGRLDTLKDSLSFLLKDDAPRKKYERTQVWEKKKDIIHWGQRKLFLSELWFLTKYGHLATCVVYAGSAPGTHIPFLAQLFPQHTFILIDPSDFDLKFFENDTTNARGRIETRQEYFTDEIATQLEENHSGNILFISDIRTANPQEQDHELVEIMVLNDNMKQRDWINIMKPKKSLLKFRCPYPDRENGKENLKMFKGEVYIQPYAAPTSTETRLVPDDVLEEIEYDNIKYEEQLYYHNHVTRKATYPQPILRGEGFNQSWDLSAEVVILYDFLTKFSDYYPSLPMFERIRKFSYDISRGCTHTSRNLETPMVRPDKRRQHKSKDHTSFYPELKGLSAAEMKQMEREDQD